MEELQLMNLEQTQITSWDFDMLKAQLQRKLDEYGMMVYTDATIKEAKADKSTLNKVKKAVEDRRKAYKAECLRPYEELEPKIKELVAMIDEQQKRIDATVKEFDERKRQEREQEIRAYYDRKAIALGDMAEALYPLIFNKKWTNATAKKKETEMEILEAIAKAQQELAEIEDMQSPFRNTLMETYAQTLSMEKVKAKEDELQEAMRKSELVKQLAEAAAKPEPVVSVPKSGQQASALQGTLLRVYAVQWQMDQLVDFMKIIGVRYEMENSDA